MERKLVLVLDDWSALAYYRPFHMFGGFTKNHDLLWKEPERIRLVVFTGGADISPSLYGDKPSLRTYCNPKRDVFEHAVFEKVRKLDLPVAGICRGAQFLCAMAGGKLFQHVNGHDWHHWCRTNDDRNFVISSTHHQMLRLPDSATLLAWADPGLSDVYIGADDREEEAPDYEVEAAYFPNIRAVGMQYHPEMMQESSQGFRYCQEIVTAHLGLEPDKPAKTDAELEAELEAIAQSDD